MIEDPIECVIPSNPEVLAEALAKPHKKWLGRCKKHHVVGHACRVPLLRCRKVHVSRDLRCFVVTENNELRLAILEQGKYRVKPDNTPGAVPGVHAVILRKMKVPDGVVQTVRVYCGSPEDVRARRPVMPDWRFVDPLS